MLLWYNIAKFVKDHKCLFVHLLHSQSHSHASYTFPVNMGTVNGFSKWNVLS